MPLSEEELRKLEELERALVQDDPKLASTLRGTPFRAAAKKRAMAFGAVFVLGVVLLMTGAVMALPVVGIIGFVVMLGAATMVVTALRAPAAPATPASYDDVRLGSDPFGSGERSGFSVIDGGRSGRGPSRNTNRGRASKSNGGPRSPFMERMEERWRRRRNGGW